MARFPAIRAESIPPERRTGSGKNGSREQSLNAGLKQKESGRTSCGGEDWACLRDARTGRWLLFSRPHTVIVANRPEEAGDCLREVERLVARHGGAAAGYLAYEAAPGCDSALPVHPDPAFPCLRFGIYPQPVPITLPPACAPLPCLNWQPTVNKPGFDRAIARVQAFIAAGESYQVNYTYRLRAPCSHDPWQLFATLAGGCEPPEYGGFLQTPDWTVVSLSPELFFRRDGETICSIPMKGTIGRGLTVADDMRQAERLAACAKNLAENVMIVDMVRNDLTRIARPGSVHATDLFAVHRYPTLWQMVSTVSARTAAPLADIFAALFPAASITGAPKNRTMAIIRELETVPRRIYTGTLGFLLPDGRSQFNVAIRTLLIDRHRGLAEYGVGGGITADSTADDEWQETLIKSLVCRGRQPDFSLLETLLWTPEQGYAYLAGHVQRLLGSASYFAYPCSEAAIRDTLEKAAAGFGTVRHRVRLLLDRGGRLRFEATPCNPTDAHRTVRVAVAPEPIDEGDVFLYHKTTHRQLYERLRGACGAGVDDVLLYNRRGEVTETAIANVVATIDGVEVTPPVHCGLLAGTCRQHLLASGRLTERVLTVEELRNLGTFSLINSVRGRYPAQLV